MGSGAEVNGAETRIAFNKRMNMSGLILDVCIPYAADIGTRQ